MSYLLKPPTPFQWQNQISLKKVAWHYPHKIIFTWILLLGEAISILLFPIAVGMSVDSLIQGKTDGLWVLALLCFTVLLFAAGRRFYDTRAYATIYRELATSLVANKQKSGITTTRLTAQVNLLYEVVNFFEDSLPSLITMFISFFGVTFILGWIDISLMGYCIGASILVIIIYALSEKQIYRFNQKQNDELEKQVDILKKNNRRGVKVHFGRIMQWNIKLSDLETLNYSAVWIVMAALLIYSIILVVENTTISAGQKLTAIMYVFEYIEVVMGFPLFYQQIIRLQEITNRLSDVSK